MEKSKVECAWCGEMKNEGSPVCCHCGRDRKFDLRVRVGFVSGMSIALGFAIMTPLIGIVAGLTMVLLGLHR